MITCNNTKVIVIIAFDNVNSIIIIIINVDIAIISIITLQLKIDYTILTIYLH